MADKKEKATPEITDEELQKMIAEKNQKRLEAFNAKYRELCEEFGAVHMPVVQIVGNDITTDLAAKLVK